MTLKAPLEARPGSGLPWPYEDFNLQLRRAVWQVHCDGIFYGHFTTEPGALIAVQHLSRTAVRPD